MDGGADLRGLSTGLDGTDDLISDGNDVGALGLVVGGDELAGQSEVLLDLGGGGVAQESRALKESNDGLTGCAWGRDSGLDSASLLKEGLGDRESLSGNEESEEEGGLFAAKASKARQRVFILHQKHGIDAPIVFRIICYLCILSPYYFSSWCYKSELRYIDFNHCTFGNDSH